MILKSMARKTATFSDLLSYMDREGVSERIVAHNLYHSLDEDMERVAESFMENAQRLSRRANGNSLYHEILSLEAGHGLSRERLTEILRDLAQVYLSERATDNLAFGIAHFDSQHVHLHLCISANAVGDSRRVRLSKESFAGIQKRLEGYILERYPELDQRTIYNSRERSREKLKTSAREQNMRHARGKSSAKEGLKARMHGIFQQATSYEDLAALLAQAGYSLYQRGATRGVLDNATGKKHRLSTLGVDEHFNFTIQRMTQEPQQQRPAQEQNKQQQPEQPAQRTRPEPERFKARPDPQPKPEPTPERTRPEPERFKARPDPKPEPAPERVRPEPERFKARPEPEKPAPEQAQPQPEQHPKSEADKVAERLAELDELQKDAKSRDRDRGHER